MGPFSAAKFSLEMPGLRPLLLGVGLVAVASHSPLQFDTPRTAYLTVLGVLNASQVAAGGSFTIELNATVTNVPATSGLRLQLHICPASVANAANSACVANSFNSDCESQTLHTSANTAEYEASLEVSYMLSPSAYPTTSLVFLLDACSAFALSPPVVPSVLVHFDVQLCAASSVCFGSAVVSLYAFFAVLSLMWTAMIGVWVANIVYFRHTFVTLQRRMLLVPVAEWLFMVMTTVSLHHEPSSLLSNVTASCRVISLAVAAHETLLIAHGWRITRDDVSVQQSMHYRVVSFIWAVTLTAVQTSVSVSLLIFLTWALSWALLTYMIWFHSAFNIAILRLQMDLVSRANIQPDTTPVYAKLRMFRVFRRCILGYFATVLAVDAAVSRLLPPPLRPLVPVVQELLYMAFCLGIGWTFRCRSFSAIFYVTFPEHVPAIAPETTAPPPTRDRQPWHEGVGLPTVPAHVMRMKSRAVVVVQSPGDETGLGTAALPKNTQAWRE
ncbi:hypothetical protein ACHHYP_11453 [Achlya hypogyna]|uniref:Transmembrane protein n=1 Tax=Achlya hypogyna TaxID=1202772 RepID=A0A1V9YJ51_ACHHY|nr:hypothetical protein ACHHYP_11453 [Achlya hypogyna]